MLKTLSGFRFWLGLVAIIFASILGAWAGAQIGFPAGGNGFWEFFLMYITGDEGRIFNYSWLLFALTYGPAILGSFVGGLLAVRSKLIFRGILVGSAISFFFSGVVFYGLQNALG